jgi:uncharacterized protein YdaU (DUF1376 family)
MSRAWMPFYAGDYLRDTGHLTTEQHGAYLLLILHCWQHGKLPDGAPGRATIARVPLKRWQTIKSEVESYFLDDGTHKRIDAEREKTERAVMQRTLAGRNGGVRSGISRAIKRGQDEARSKRDRSEPQSEIEANHEARSQAKTKLPGTNHIRKITSSEQEAARPPPVEKPQEQTNTAGLLATALPTGALARQPETEQAAEQPYADCANLLVANETPSPIEAPQAFDKEARAKLDAVLAAKRKPKEEIDLSIPGFLQRTA